MPIHIYPAKGDKGDKGNQGIQGIQGIQGTPGDGVTWMGEWDSGTAYSEFDGVEYLGSSYIANTTVDNTNKLPTNTAFWDLWVAKGDSGTDTRAIVIKTADYTMTTSNDIIVCNKTTPMTITLFVGTGLTGRIRTVSNINIGLVTVSLAGDAINGETSQTVGEDESMDIIDIAANTWIIL